LKQTASFCRTYVTICYVHRLYLRALLLCLTIASPPL
jgi:hypothetical protein